MSSVLSQIPRPWRIAVVGVAVVAVVLAGLAGWRSWGKDPAAVKVPYTDPQARGAITLCSADGKQVSDGSLTDRPFTDLVVGSTGLPADKSPEGAVGTLFAYQPRPGITPDEFNGSPLTAAEELTDPAHPSITVPQDAWSIGDFVAAYPATADGFVQLRLVLGTPRDGTLTREAYATADLRVTGDKWVLVTGGSAPCPQNSQGDKQ